MLCRMVPCNWKYWDLYKDTPINYTGGANAVRAAGAARAASLIFIEIIAIIMCIDLMHARRACMTSSEYN